MAYDRPLEELFLPFLWNASVRIRDADISQRCGFSKVMALHGEYGAGR